jgi:hypothetical protein
MGQPQGEDGIGFGELCKLAFARWEFFVKVWDVYKIVALAMLGFVAATPGLRASLPVTIVVSLGFLGFAVCHYLGMISVRDQIEALATAAKTRVPKDDSSLEELCKQLAPPERWKLVAFHAVLDIGFVVALLVIHGLA